MGMYDTIYCEYKLPMPTDPKGFVGCESFQTKDLACELATYKIDKDGTLHIQKVLGHRVEPENKKSNSIFDSLGRFVIDKQWYEPVNDTTTINMYDFQNHDDGDYDYFIEYRICLVKGIIIDVFITEFTAHDNADRKKRDIEFKKKLQENWEFRQTRRYRYLYKHYNYCVSFVFRRLNKFVSSIHSNLYKIERIFKI